MRLIDADVLEEKFCGLEAQALIHVGKINERDGDEFSEEWKIWSAILQERTAFKHDVFDSPTIETVEENGRWIPCNERLPKKEQYVLVSTDMNYVATATFKGDYWESTFDLDWEEVLAWQPTPKPFEVKK